MLPISREFFIKAESQCDYSVLYTQRAVAQCEAGVRQQAQVKREMIQRPWEHTGNILEKQNCGIRTIFFKAPYASADAIDAQFTSFIWLAKLTTQPHFQ